MLMSQSLKYTKRALPYRDSKKMKHTRVRETPTSGHIQPVDTFKAVFSPDQPQSH